MAILSTSPAPTPPRRRSVSQASGRDPSLPAVDRPRSTSCGRQVPTPRSQSLQRSLGPRGEARSEARKKEPPRVEGLPAVLFLDVDGVLHPVQARHPRQQFATGCLALVADVVKATGAAICLSTAWRLDPSARRFVEEKLREFGLGPPIGRTPNLAQFHRSREILAWVQEDSKMHGHFVQSRPRFGLQPDTAQRVVELFKAQQQPLKSHA
ncbi:unnamed protein product [Cladocopium goreaui]|uniref:FCP1 homology domain-containing protein n=1 Tax=Cladocopium goreaui TaxID=2562237 RepID=A0A9P1GCZ1_9DINO|nr:unnamed protein product [Cladocopium goreaui]